LRPYDLHAFKICSPFIFVLSLVESKIVPLPLSPWSVPSFRLVRESRLMRSTANTDKDDDDEDEGGDGFELEFSKNDSLSV
jgi:hypothetical protein